MLRRRPVRPLLAIAAIAVVAAACTQAVTASQPAAPAAAAPGLTSLKHLIFIVQENRSFDHYFGTYPGADGIPTNPDGSFSVCVPDTYQHGKCVTPYVSRSVEFDGGPHDHPSAVRDVDGGKMDGFIASLPERGKKCWIDRTQPICDTMLGPQGQPDVMSTLRRGAIPNYWAYADRFALQDRMFASVDSWTLPSHLFLMSAWAAYCPDPTDPMSCRTDLNMKRRSHHWEYGDDPIYAWTDITWLLDQHDVSWALLHRLRHVLGAAVRRSGPPLVLVVVRAQPDRGLHELLGGRARRHPRQPAVGEPVPHRRGSRLAAGGRAGSCPPRACRITPPGPALSAHRWPTSPR